MYFSCLKEYNDITSLYTTYATIIFNALELCDSATKNENDKKEVKNNMGI